MQTIEEVRRARLAMLEKEYGGQAALAEHLGKSPAQLSQWRNASITASGRGWAMSSDAAREIEEKTGKPRGWMDTPIGFHEAMESPEIQHVLHVMEQMSPYELGQAVKIIDALKPATEGNEG